MLYSGVKDKKKDNCHIHSALHTVSKPDTPGKKSINNKRVGGGGGAGLPHVTKYASYP